VKSHGGADSSGFAAAVELGYDMVRNRLLDRIEADLDLFHARNPHKSATRRSVVETGEEG
jgi:glycerol-3-phosphate acyltransferase PlsX